MRMRTIFMIFAVTVLAVSLGLAQYSARESFEYGVGTSIDTLMGTAGNGWAGSWYWIQKDFPNAAVASDTGLPYDALTYSVSHVGNCLQSVPDTDATGQRWGRDLAQTWPNDSGSVYWVSLLMDVKNADDNATWIGMKFYYGASSENGMLGKGHGLDKYTCGSGWHGGPGVEVSNVAWTVGPVWLVGKIDMYGATAATMDTIKMWINPDPDGAEPSATPDAYTSLKFNPGFNVIRLEFGGNVGNGLNVSFDEIRLGTSWAEVSAPITGINQLPIARPAEFVLSQNYPNPFNPSTVISYTLEKTGLVRLTVYDLLGREVSVLVNGVQSAGPQQITFAPENLPSGLYFYTLESGGMTATKKMIMLK